MAGFQRGLALAHAVLRAFPFTDVEVATDVASKSAVGSVLRNRRRHQPSVSAVGMPKAVLQQEWSACFKRRHVRGEAALQVLWMNAIQPPVARQLLERVSGELRDRAIEVVEGRVR